MKLLHEKQAAERQQVLIGVDEAGRGPICGPLYVAAFSVTPGFEDCIPWSSQISDSKAVSEEKREKTYLEMKADANVFETAIQPPDGGVLTLLESSAYTFAFIEISPEIIDAHNILWATLYGMRICSHSIAQRIAEKSTTPLDFHIMVDGNRLPPHIAWAAGNPVPNSLTDTAMILSITSQTLVKGDSIVFSIGAASFVAKVERDDAMRVLHQQYPQYALDSHKGYATPAHKALVKAIGPSKIHRLTFEPCYSLLALKEFPVPGTRKFEIIPKKKITQYKPPSSQKSNTH